VPEVAHRAAYIAGHAPLWRASWAVWMTAGISLIAFFAWWGAWLSSPRLVSAALALAVAGLICDLFAESLFIGWLPHRTDTVAPFASLLTGGAANGLYTIAGALLTLGTRALHGSLRVWAWAIWVSGFALTISTAPGSVLA
jgi:hypothetical protein